MKLIELLKIKTNKIINPYLERNNFNGESSLKKENRMLEPSSGGIGIRLKTAKPIFTITIKRKLLRSGVEFIPITDDSLKINAKINANRKLLKGPANPTRPYSFFGFFKL